MGLRVWDAQLTRMGYYTPKIPEKALYRVHYGYFKA